MSQNGHAFVDGFWEQESDPISNDFTCMNENTLEIDLLSEEEDLAA